MTLILILILIILGFDNILLFHREPNEPPKTFFLLAGILALAICVAVIIAGSKML